jgi:cation:H+ antiporter
VDIIWNLFLVALGTAIVWKSSDRLEEASDRIATHYGIPEIVKGAVILAVASSFPELSSVIISTLAHGKFELGVSTIVGSAIFNILVIPGCAVLLGGPLAANRELVFKEALFYLIAVAVLLLTFSFAVIYYPAPGEPVLGTLTRGLVLIPIILYAIYIFIQYQDAKDNAAENPTDTVGHVLREWFILALCMLIVALGVELLIRAAINLGNLLNTPSSLWGLTVVAAGTSLPDLFISVKASREGKSIASLSNVLGSNTFDLLVAVPVGILLAGATVVNFSRSVPMMGSLTLATIVMFVLMRMGMILTRRDAVILLAVYLAFVVWMTLEAIGVSSILATQGAAP